MKIILFALCFLALANTQTQTQCADGQQLYYGTCLQPNCFDYVQRIRLTGIRNDGSGTINPGIAIDTQLVEGQGVKVSLYYFDDADGYYADKGGRLESGCVQAFVYSTEGLFPSGQKRINLDSNGRANWPTLTKVYDEASANTITSFMVTISDLQTKGCKKSEVDGNQQFQCFFEYAWEVSEVAQAKYFFNIKVQVNTDLTATTGADFEPLVEQEPNPPACYMEDGTAEEVCVQNINSALLYCKDSTCVDTKTEPYRELYLNSKFWITHKITDGRFSNKKLLLRELTMTATNTKLTLTPLEKREENGQIVMQIQVILAVEDGTLTSEAYVADSNRRILQGVALRRSLEEDNRRGLQAGSHREYQDLNVTIESEEDGSDTIVFGFISAFSALMVLMFLMI